MVIRPFRPADAPALAELASACARTETEFVLNPLWESADELFGEFARFGISPEDHLLVADAGEGEVVGLAGFLCRPGAALAGLYVPIVEQRERGRGLGGELLRAALHLGAERLGVKLAAAAVGTRNSAGYSLLASTGFRPVRQHFLMRSDAPPKAAKPALPGLAFQLASPAAAPGVLGLYESCGFETRSIEEMERVLADPLRSTAVALSEGRVVAFAELDVHWPRRVWVSFVGVATGLRDRGLGSALVSWALDRRFAAGARQALLLLSPANRTAIRAYEKAGFRRHRVVDVLEKEL